MKPGVVFEVSGCGVEKNSGMVDTNISEISRICLVDTQDETNVFPYYSITDRIGTTDSKNTWIFLNNVYDKSNGLYKNIYKLLTNIYNFNYKNFNILIDFLYFDFLFHPTRSKYNNYEDGSDGYYTYEESYNIISSAYKSPNRAILFRKYTKTLSDIYYNSTCYTVNDSSINNKYFLTNISNGYFKNFTMYNNKGLHIGYMKINNFHIYNFDSIENFIIFKNVYKKSYDQMAFLVPFPLKKNNFSDDRNYYAHL